MTLSTVVVCDSVEKSEQIVGLVNSQPDLSLIEIVSRDAALEQISNTRPKLVWLELAPEPTEAIVLLSDLRGHCPATHVLVSYESLNADLVKASMQLGAIDYLDAQSWQEQLPEAISRVLIKEKAAQEATSIQDFEQLEPQERDEEEMLEEQPSKGTGLVDVEMEAPGWPVWVIPSLALLLLFVFALLQLAR